MVQYKKDEIKEKIDMAALTVFADKGFAGTKISDIAQSAAISVGNIYRYYSSKNEIFYSVVPEGFITELMELLKNKIYATKGKNLHLLEETDEVWFVNDEVIRFMVKNRYRMLIIFKNSQGTKYENIMEELINFLAETVKTNFIAKYKEIPKGQSADFVINTVYENLILMTLRVLEKSQTAEEVKNHLEAINSYHLFGITGLFSQSSTN